MAIAFERVTPLPQQASNAGTVSGMVWGLTGCFCTQFCSCLVTDNHDCSEFMNLKPILCPDMYFLLISPSLVLTFFSTSFLRCSLSLGKVCSSYPSRPKYSINPGTLMSYGFLHPASSSSLRSFSDKPWCMLNLWVQT